MKKTSRAIWNRGSIAFKTEFITTCKPGEEQQVETNDSMVGLNWSSMVMWGALTGNSRDKTKWSEDSKGSESFHIEPPSFLCGDSSYFIDGVNCQGKEPENSIKIISLSEKNVTKKSHELETVEKVCFTMHQKVIKTVVMITQFP